MTYSGLDSGSDTGAPTDSLDEEASNCSSSSKEASGSSTSFSSRWLLRRRDPEHAKWTPPAYTVRPSDVDTMKERFTNLLLGEDASGGSKGVGSALALSRAISNLAVSIYGELWRLEPLPDEKKDQWRREMDWLLSPTSYMVELVPARQNGVNGSTLEIMTPKARADVQMVLPALRKLDSMLVEVLDSMVDTEFWYEEGGSRGEGRPEKRWWLPCPRVPERGLSPSQRKRLGFQGKTVYQVLKAAKSINESVLLQMPLPSSLDDALPKSGRASLGPSLYRMIVSEVISVDEVIGFLNLKSEHVVLETVNRLEAAIYAWSQKISSSTTRRSPVRSSLSFMWDTGSELDKDEYSLDRAESLLRCLKLRFPNLPQSFLDVTKVQYNKDVGHAITEAYSRVLSGLAFSILSRIGDVLQEDDLNKPATPVAKLKFDFCSDVYLAGITETPPGLIKRSLMDQMNSVDSRVPNARKGLEMSLRSKAGAAMAEEGIGMSPHRSLLLHWNTFTLQADAPVHKSRRYSPLPVILNRISTHDFTSLSLHLSCLATILCRCHHHAAFTTER